MIPVNETIDIIKNELHQNSSLSKLEIKEIIKLLKTILSQNYFTFNDKFYFQSKCLAMSSPLSDFLDDVYLQQKYLFSNNNIITKNIIFYTRYVDDSFIIYNGTNRQLNSLKSYLNSINSNIQFTLETENNNSINFLDITVTKNNNQFHFNRKPTTMDHVIHADSYHSHTQKMASFNSFIH